MESPERVRRAWGSALVRLAPPRFSRAPVRSASTGQLSKVFHSLRLIPGGVRAALFNAVPGLSSHSVLPVGFSAFTLASFSGHAQSQRFTFGLNSWPTALRVKRWGEFKRVLAL